MTEPAANSNGTTDPRAASVMERPPPEKKLKIGIGTLIAAGGFLIGAATFASNYIYATKVELGDHRTKSGERITKVEGEMDLVRQELKTNRRWLRRVHAEQKVDGANIRKLLQARSINPIDPETIDAYRDLRVGPDEIEEFESDE